MSFKKRVYSPKVTNPYKGGIHPVKQLTELKVTDLLKEFNTTFKDHWEMYDMARTPSRRDYRNGYWKRYILLKDGRLELRMPRMRSVRYESHIIPRYKKRMPEVDETLKRIFLYGASTRRTSDALKPILGESISAQTISKSLDEEVHRYHTRHLHDIYRYLFLDGISLKVKTGLGTKKRVILVAYGITVSGKRELIDFMIVKHESENAWEGFFNNLYQRGLVGDFLELIITDGSYGLIKTLIPVYHTRDAGCIN